MSTITRGDLFLPTTRLMVAPERRPESNEELIEDFLRWKRSYTKWAFKTYRIWVTRFQVFVDCPPEQVTSADYVDFSDSIRDRFAPKNVQYALNVVHNYLRYFSEQGRLSFPMYFVRVPKARSESHYCVTEDEYQQMLQSLQMKKGSVALRNEVVVRMLHDTGMRIGELLALKVDDIEDERSALIPTEKTIDDRHVFWSEQTDDRLRAMIRLWRTKVDKAEPQSSEVPLFRSERDLGSSLCSRTVQRMIKRTCSAAGASERICPHSFRHAFIHRMARKGVPDSVTAVLVGHSTPVTVSQYTKLSSKEQRHFAEASSLG